VLQSNRKEREREREREREEGGEDTYSVGSLRKS
jgi:hypothetical protein